MELYRLLDLLELNLSGEELNWNVTPVVSSCTGIEWMHQHMNMNGMIPFWTFNSKALVCVYITEVRCLDQTSDAQPSYAYTYYTLYCVCVITDGCNWGTAAELSEAVCVIMLS